MGWWSATILGGDGPLDALGGLMDLIGVNTEEKGWEEQLDAVRDGLQALPEANILAFISDGYDAHINAQVAGVVYMRSGAKLPEEVKDRAIEAAQNEDCSNWNDPSERRERLDEFVRYLKAYDGSPTEIPEEGLFETFHKRLGM